LLNSNISPTCLHNTVNFGVLAAEIRWRVWGTPANFNGFRILAALLHGTLVVGVSQTAALNRGRHLYSVSQTAALNRGHHLYSALLHGDPARPQRCTAPQLPIFGPCQLWPNGRPSELLLNTCWKINRNTRHQARKQVSECD